MYPTRIMLATVLPVSSTQPPSSHDTVLVMSNNMGPALDSTWLVNLQHAISEDVSIAGSLPSVYGIDSLAPASVAGKVCVFVGEIDNPLHQDHCATGARVEAECCNVSNNNDLVRASHVCVESGLLPIRGVIQAATVAQVSNPPQAQKVHSLIFAFPDYRF